MCERDKERKRGQERDREGMRGRGTERVCVSKREGEGERGGNTTARERELEREIPPETEGGWHTRQGES